MQGEKVYRLTCRTSPGPDSAISSGPCMRLHSHIPLPPQSEGTDPNFLPMTRTSGLWLFGASLPPIALTAGLDLRGLICQSSLANFCNIRTLHQTASDGPTR